jgi:hypothetical protein
MVCKQFQGHYDSSKEYEESFLSLLKAITYAREAVDTLMEGPSSLLEGWYLSLHFGMLLFLSVPVLAEEVFCWLGLCGCFPTLRSLQALMVHLTILKLDAGRVINISITLSFHY